MVSLGFKLGVYLQQWGKIRLQNNKFTNQMVTICYTKGVEYTCLQMCRKYVMANELVEFDNLNIFS